MRDINDKVNNGGATPDGQYPAEEFNSLKNEARNAVLRSGQSLDPASVLQMAESMFLHGTKATAFQAGGTANAVTLTPISGTSGVKVPASYSNMGGARVLFKPTASNTGAVTVDIGQSGASLLGPKQLRKPDGTSQLDAGDLDPSLWSEIQYNASGDYWVLLPWSLPSSQLTLPLSVTNGGTGASDAATARGNLGVPPDTRNIATQGLATGGGNLQSDRTIDVPIASQAQAEAGTNNATAMTPLRVAQAIAALGSGLKGIQVFTTPGAATWNKPAGVSSVLIIATGGGGGGGGTPSSGTDAQASGGGGGGGTVMRVYDVSGISSLSLNIGGGGAANTTGTGSTGGNTTVADGATTIATANGGVGGTGTSVISADNISQGGNGGSSSVNSGQAVLMTGVDGETGMVSVSGSTKITKAGPGGASFWGGNGRGAHKVLGNSAIAQPGTLGGGGGGGVYDGLGAVVPADGGDGVVVIIEF